MTSARTEKKAHWWKPSRRTVVTVFAALGAIALLAALVFAGSDGSGDAAGQGLASAFEAALFAFGVGLIAFVALIVWLSQHLRPLTITMFFMGAALAIAIIFLM